MKPHFRHLETPLGVPIPVFQMKRRAAEDALKPETWIDFEAEFAETPFLQLTALLDENEERV
jgi:hypothetical protein